MTPKQKIEILLSSGCLEFKSCQVILHFDEKSDIKQIEVGKLTLFKGKILDQNLKKVYNNVDNK